MRVLRGVKLHSINLVEGPPDPSKGIYPITLVEPEEVTGHEQLGLPDAGADGRSPAVPDLRDIRRTTEEDR